MKGTMRWMEVGEQLPEEDKLVVTYCEVFGTYCLAKWTAARGWMGQDNLGLRVITHWMDLEIPLPFPILKETNKEAAEKYGLNSCDY